jgi:preprotein translocase subunit YajC
MQAECAFFLLFSVKKRKSCAVLKIFTNSPLHIAPKAFIIICDYFYKTEDLIMGDWTMLLMLGGLLVVMYFVMIRPQKKQEKEQNDMRNNLAVGDEITTIGGIIGKIVSIKEETCVIETSHERTKMRILKSAVSRVDVKAEDAE